MIAFSVDPISLDQFSQSWMEKKFYENGISCLFKRKPSKSLFSLSDDPARGILLTVEHDYWRRYFKSRARKI